PFALLGGGETWVPNRTRGPGREFPAEGWVIAAATPARWERKVLCQLHMDKDRGDVEHQGRIQLAAMHRTAWPLNDRRKIHCEHIHRQHACLFGADGAQRLLMGVIVLGSQDKELPDACPL